MISRERMQEILEQNKILTITFVGLAYKNSKEAALYTYHGTFILEDDRLSNECMTIGDKRYSRSIKKIICITKGRNLELLYGKRCRSCGIAMPRSHGNCFSCYSENYEQRY